MVFKMTLSMEGEKEMKQMDVKIIHDSFGLQILKSTIDFKEEYFMTCKQ